MRLIGNIIQPENKLMESDLIPVQLNGSSHKGEHRRGICFANQGSMNTQLIKTVPH